MANVPPPSRFSDPAPEMTPFQATVCPAPALSVDAPAADSGLVKVPAANSVVPPLIAIVPVPRPEPDVALSDPAVSCTPPVKVLAPVSVNVPAPVLVTPPLPVSVPPNVTFPPAPPSVTNAPPFSATVPVPASDVNGVEKPLRSSVAPVFTNIDPLKPNADALPASSVPPPTDVAPA